MIISFVTSRILKSKMKTISDSEDGARELIKDNAFLRMVFSFFHKRAEKVLKSKPKLVELLTKALLFFKKISDIPFLKNNFLDIPNICDMLTDVINGVYKEVPYASLLMIVMAILYMVCPFDLLPDSIFFAGLFDDAAVLKMVLRTVKKDMEAYNEWKATRVAC